MSKRDDDIRDEIEFHLDTERAEREAEGLSPTAARAAARRGLGSPAIVAEDMRAVWRRAWLDSFVQDLRLAFRSLRREPGFFLAAIACLTLGIGANTAVFSLLNAFVLRSLPYPEPHRLVTIFERRPLEAMERNVVSAADFLDWRDQARSFSRIAGWEGVTFNLTGLGEPRHPSGATVTAGFFDVLGTGMEIGRGIRSEDESSGESVVVVSHGFWQRHLGSDPAAAGRAIVLDGKPYTVIGVLPAAFVPVSRSWELFVPAKFTAESRNARGNHYLTVLARLAPGVSLEQARAEMDGISKRLEQTYVAVNKGHFANVVPMDDALRGELRPRALLMTGAVALVLLMACFNVANLLLARSLSRAREIATRLMLGGQRLRIVRQLLTESLVLALTGAALGVAVAWGVAAGLRAVLPPHPSVAPGDVRLDLSALGYTAAVAIVSTLVFGLAPALAATSGTVLEAAKSGGRLLTPSRARGRQHSAILVAETALAFVLLFGAALFLRSFWKVQSTEPGFRAENLVTMQVTLPYREDERKLAFAERMLGKVRALPGVSNAAITSFLPFADGNSRMGLVIDGLEQAPGEPRRANWRLVTPGYFETMKIPLLRGRYLNQADRKGAPPVMIVSETTARRYWGGRDPVGTRARLSGIKEWAVVAGVVGDVKHWGLEESTRPEVYYSSLQIPFFLTSLVVRTDADPEATMASLRGALREVDKDIPPLALRAMDDLIAESNSPRRFLTLLVAAFGVVAALLAAGGIFAQLAYAVSRRYQEIGVRLALGASPLQVVFKTMQPGLACAAGGIAIGLVACALLGRYLEKMLFGVTPRDGWTFGVAPLAMLAIAALASLVPAWRAARTDPAAALRLE